MARILEMPDTAVDDMSPNPDTTIQFSNNSDAYLDQETQGLWIQNLGKSIYNEFHGMDISLLQQIPK